MQLYMQVNSPQIDRSSLEQVLELPTPTGFSRGCPRSARMELDHLLLAIEAIDLQATDVMLHLVEQLQLQAVIPNRVTFWRIRNTNPLRRQYQRANLSWDEARALTMIICAIARPVNTLMRQMVTTCQQIAENKIDLLGLQQNKFFLDGYAERFRSLYISRMRSPSPLDNDEIRELALQTLTQLLFCGGSTGEVRLWHSLFDGAVA